ncbi:MHYT domain-containing protein [Streptomyces sp. NPDC088847]|uniref:MHYT domain-containing protein n=1 Tax=Streptomyces sp. NPDC088847 TaxID=3365909 RepID=UPI00380DBF68
MITTVVAFLIACFGSALGLRCTTRSLGKGRQERRGPWLLLGAICIGSGIWTMYFIAMIGFTITGVNIEYDRSMTFLSMVVAAVLVSIGIFIVGYRGTSPPTLGTAGLITGLDVATMHYIGLRGLRFDGRMTFASFTVPVPVIIAVVAATAALWAASAWHRQPPPV